MPGWKFLLQNRLTNAGNKRRWNVCVSRRVQRAIDGSEQGFFRGESRAASIATREVHRNFTRRRFARRDGSI